MNLEDYSIKELLEHLVQRYDNHQANLSRADKLIEAVSKAFKVDPFVVRSGKRRSQRVAWARNVAMIAIRKDLHWTYQDIAEAVGLANASSAIKAADQAEKIAGKHPVFVELVRVAGKAVERLGVEL